MLRLVAVLDAEEIAARIRAARAYAKLRREDLAAAISISPSALDFMEGKRDVIRVPDVETQWKIAAACGLPAEWFAADFERLRQITLDGAAVPARQMPAARLPPPRGELARRLQDRRREREDRHESDSGPDTDAPTGSDG